MFLVTLAFTFSTTGIFCGLLLIILFLYKFSKNRAVSISVFGFLIFAILSYGMIAEGSYLYYSLFGKMEDVNDSYINGGSGNSTADTRVFSLIFTLDEFIKSPIVGIGLEGHENMAKRGLGGGGATITPLLLFANFGILMGLIHTIGIVKAMELRQKKIIEATLVLLIPILSTMSEQLAFNPILMSISMYGYLILPTQRYHRKINEGKSIGKAHNGTDTYRRRRQWHSYIAKFLYPVSSIHYSSFIIYIWNISYSRIDNKHNIAHAFPSFNKCNCKQRSSPSTFMELKTD